MFRGKEVLVSLSEEAAKIYLELNKITGEEKLKGAESSFHQTLLRSINRVKELLEVNPFIGEQVQKFKIPKKYIKKYGVTNVWRAELSDRWRLIYTITGTEVVIITFIMDIFNHKDYDKVFGYKH